MPDPFISESNSLTPTTSINIIEEFNFNNPLILMPEQPCPIDPSNLEFVEPLGYMWSDGIMTLTEDRDSRIIKKYTPTDPWIPTQQPSTFNDLLQSDEISENKQISGGLYIMERANRLI